LASSTVQGGGTARLLQIVFDQSVLASLRNPIVDQLATHWTPYHKAAPCEPVQHDANVRCLNGSTAFASGLQLLQQVYVLWGKCHFNRRSEAFPHYFLLARANTSHERGTLCCIQRANQSQWMLRQLFRKQGVSSWPPCLSAQPRFSPVTGDNRMTYRHHKCDSQSFHRLVDSRNRQS
jgi:hypothetical protein